MVLAGIGDTAPPQAPLSISQHDNVTAIWSAIAKAGGAAVEVDPAPLGGPAPAHVPAVLLVPVPAVSTICLPGGGCLTTLPDTLLFHFNSATLLPTADTVLRPLAEQARSDHQLVSITGYASPEGSATYNVALSKRRAIAVRNRLIALGVPPAQIISVTGLGAAGQSLDYCLANGQLDEARCATLRRVVVELSSAGATR